MIHYIYTQKGTLQLCIIDYFVGNVDHFLKFYTDIKVKGQIK